MTNEQLAKFIKQGGNDELLPLLWEKTHNKDFSQSKKTAILRSPYNNAVGRFKPVFISMIFFLTRHVKLILEALAFGLGACNYKLTYKNLHENILKRQGLFYSLAASIIPMF